MNKHSQKFVVNSRDTYAGVDCEGKVISNAPIQPWLHSYTRYYYTRDVAESLAWYEIRGGISQLCHLTDNVNV